MKKLNLNKETVQVLQDSPALQVDGAAWNIFSIWGDLCNGTTSSTYGPSICYVS